MKNILLIAKREFLSTVATKAFIIGLLVLPALIAISVLIFPRMLSPRNFKLQGEIAVIDPTGRVMPELLKTFDPARIAARRKEEAERALATAPQQVRSLAGNSAARAMADREGPVPEIHILKRPPDANLAEEKNWLNTQPKDMPRLALIVIHANAVSPAGTGREYGTYDWYVPPTLDDRASSEIQRALREAIVNARIQAQSLDQAAIEAITWFPPVQSVTVTQNEQRKTVQGFNMLLPAAFGVLLFIGVMGGGGQLLNSMVEEKSSRVVEVLLSAVSPIELMAGKLLGQMAVSLVGMSLYLALGIALLVGFALFGLLNFALIFYLLIFFIITYVVMGSLMMAIGAAVNDMKEAQTLMMPLTIIFIIPWILWLPISSNPGSAFSTALSFLPPINTFVMLLRMCSNTPPPIWQVWLSIGVGLGSAYGAVWFAAKVFRIALLMFGKPPSFATLIRWAREA
jgi:ABC-2 type transport system permease protein